MSQLTLDRREASIVEETELFDPRNLAGFLKANFLLIVSVGFGITLLGAIYAYTARPVYESTILFQIDENPGAPKNNAMDLSFVLDPKSATAPEIEVLRSRRVVSRVVNDTGACIEVQPKYFPGIGDWISRLNKHLTPEILQYGGYSWGAESADVTVFNVPGGLERKKFILTAGSNNRFLVSQEELGIAFEGTVGDTVRVQTGKGEITLKIDKLSAYPGARFSLVRLPLVEVVDKLRHELRISERGKQTGIIDVTLEGTDPGRILNVLSAISREYLRYLDERKSQATDRTLATLNYQLPQLKDELERYESKYNEIRKKYRTVDLGEEAKAVLQRSVHAQTRLLELRQKKDELMSRFTEQHPAVDAVNREMRVLESELAGVNARVQMLPAEEQEILRLKRDVQVNTEVYTAVLSTARQLRLATSSNIANVHLLDSPEMPVIPVRPKPALIIGSMALIGILFGILAAIARKIMYNRVADPREIEQSLGLTVAATIPRSGDPKRAFLPTRYQKSEREKKMELVALSTDSESNYVIESFRRFRSLLQHAMNDSENNIITITGPAPFVGKSFVSANFATVLASAGKRVLLIDGDLRTGHLHQYFGLERGIGLADAIAGYVPPEKLVHKAVVENVDFISTGKLPRKPAELLASANLEHLLHVFSHTYDFVLIDTAPILAVSDALAIARYSGTVFNVVRAGITTVSEIEDSIKQFNQAGIAITGVVLNDFKPNPARYRYSYLYELQDG